LIRFLSSKGEIKDAEAIRNLSDLEVAAIENGIPNTRFLEISGFSKRINQIMYQFKWYFEGGNPSGHSLTQRLEFLKAGWHIFKRNPLIGVGTGDLKDEFIKEYETGQTKLDKAFQKRTHNQFATFFITYGILGVSVILILFLIAIRMNTLRTSLYFLSFMIVFVVSCLNEDTLETQAGVSFFAFFFSLLMFARKEKQ
jgi:O-antigen ligase